MHEIGKTEGLDKRKVEASSFFERLSADLFVSASSLNSYTPPLFDWGERFGKYQCCDHSYNSLRKEYASSSFRLRKLPLFMDSIMFLLVCVYPLQKC